MNILEKYVTGALALVALYLVLKDAGKTNDVLSGLANLNRSAFSTLQGR